MTKFFKLFIKDESGAAIVEYGLALLVVASITVGAFSALAGIIVLIGALATSRMQRLREGALLKTLGARRNQVLTVLFPSAG